MARTPCVQFLTCVPRQLPKRTNGRTGGEMYSQKDKYIPHREAHGEADKITQARLREVRKIRRETIYT